MEEDQLHAASTASVVFLALFDISTTSIASVIILLFFLFCKKHELIEFGLFSNIIILEEAS